MTWRLMSGTLRATSRGATCQAAFVSAVRSRWPMALGSLVKAIGPDSIAYYFDPVLVLQRAGLLKVTKRRAARYQRRPVRT